jgi:alkanesulfonate monooxygenase SsuD/methylene tetrahydromethanopterin reductase-like flavin-dependent oxidoreductase (luciferase family)
MGYKIALGINWQGKPDFKGMIERARAADEAGAHSIWVAEAWGRDSFTSLTLLAEHTRRIGLATGIVNTYSRTPGALAQHFATLDELSGGRMIIGLGTSGPQVIEHFHGVAFNPPLTRMREYVDIINLLMAGQPLNYDGKLFKLKRGFTLRFEPPRKHIPIWIASLNQKSVEFTAQKADGWLPVMIPLGRLKESIADFRALAASAGRDPKIRRGEIAQHDSCDQQSGARARNPGRDTFVLRGAHGHLLCRAAHAFRLRRRRAPDSRGVGGGRLEGRDRGGLAPAN